MLWPVGSLLVVIITFNMMQYVRGANQWHELCKLFNELAMSGSAEAPWAEMLFLLNFQLEEKVKTVIHQFSYPGRLN